MPSTIRARVMDDEGDNLDEAERAALNESISRAWRSVQAGHGRPAKDVLDDLRRP